MHYWIDGYNLLYRLTDPDSHFTQKRETLIAVLSRKVADASDVYTVVFDACYAPEGGISSHLGHLEVLYTTEGQSADDCLVEQMERVTHPANHVVVTSDQRLAWRVRRTSVKTMGVGQFLKWMRKQKNPPKPPSQEQSSKIKRKKTEKPPSKGSSIEDAFGYYWYVFEEKNGA
ncbi:MAG: NYN domain-containing protein [Chlamydiia bacterium]|nr:NYN domain-containing protein [Chlamydiia bacterium]